MVLFVFEYLLYILFSAFLLGAYKFAIGIWVERQSAPMRGSALLLSILLVISMYPIYGVIIGCLAFWSRHCAINGAHFSGTVQLTLDLIGVLVVFVLTRGHAFLPSSSIADRLVALFEFVFICVVTGVLFKIVM